MTTSCKGYARISISLNEIHESDLKPHLFDHKVYDNDMIEDTTPSVINTGTRQLKPDELYKVMSSFSTSKGETSLLRTHDFRETSSLAVNGHTVVCDKRQLTETDQLLDSEDEVSNRTKRMSEESSQHKMLDFPNLTEQEIREKLQDDDVIEQFHVIDSLSQIYNSNLSMLEHVNRTNPAIRRITMKTRLTASEVKDVCIDEDIAVIVNEFLQTNWTGNHIVGRVLREHYSTLYSWLTVHLQVERNAWASRLKQALENINKQRRDSLEMNEFIVKSVNRIQHLIKSCTLAMLGESVEVSENKTCLLSSTTDTSTQERDFSRTNGFNTHLKIISNSSQVAHEAAGRSTLCSNEQRHQTHKQLFKKTTSSLDMPNYKGGNNNHSSSTSFDKPNHSSSTSFDKPNHSSNTSFDNKPNHSSSTRFYNKPNHSSSTSFDNKPNHSSSTSFDNKPNHSSSTSFDNKPNHSSSTSFDKPNHSSSTRFDNKPNHSSSTSFDKPNHSSSTSFDNKPNHSSSTSCDKPNHSSSTSCDKPNHSSSTSFDNKPNHSSSTSFDNKPNHSSSTSCDKPNHSSSTSFDNKPNHSSSTSFDNKPNHSSSTSFDKTNHSSSTSFDNKPNHSSSTSFDNKPNHSSNTHFDNKRKHSSSPSFDNKPKHSSSTGFDQVNLSTISTLRNDSDVFPLSGHTYRQINNRDISRNELCSNNCCVTNTELSNEDDTTCIFNNTGHKTRINTTTLPTSDQDEFNAYNHDMDYRSSLCESIDDLTNVCGKLFNILTTSLQHRPVSCGNSPVRFPAVSTCMQDTHTHSYIKREDLEKHLQTLETDNIHILNEMRTLRNFLNEKSEEIMKLQHEIITLSNSLKEKSEEIMYLQHEIITLRNSLKEKSEEIMKLQHQIITLRNSLTEKSEEIMKLQNQIQTLETILKDSTRSNVHRYLSTDFTLLNNHKINMTNNYLLNGVHGSSEVPNSKKIQMLGHRNKLTENIDVSNSVMAQGVTSLTEHTLETKQKNHSHMNTRVMLTEEDNISTCQLTSIEKIPKRFKFRASKSVMEAAILKHTSKKETRDQCNFEIIVKAVPKVSSNKSKNVRLQNITTSPVLRCSSNSFSGSINSNAITRYSRNDMKPSLKVLESAIYIEGDILSECQYLDQSNLLAESPATETSISCRGYSSVNDDRVVNTRAIKQTKESVQLCNKSGNNKNNVKHTECIANNSNKHINERNVVAQNIYQSQVGSLVSKPMKRVYSRVKYQLLQSNMGTIVSKPLQTKSEHMMQRLDRKMVVSKCLRCQQLFTFMDNHKLACSYHKDTVTSLEQHDHGGQVIKVTRQWTCCLQPESASGCCHGKHI